MQRKRKKTPYEFQFQSTRISYLASLPFYWYFSVLPTFFINLFYWLSSSDSVFFYHSRTFMDSLRWVRVIMLNGWMERKTNFWRVIDPVYWMQFLISNDHAIFAFVTINFVFDESFRSTCFPAKWTVIKWGSVKSFPFFSLFPPQSKIIKLWLNATEIFVRQCMAGQSVEIQTQRNSIMSHSPATPSKLWVSSFIYSIIILFMDVLDIRPFYLCANPSFKNWLDAHEILINLYDIILCFFVLLRHEIFTLWQKTHTSILITLQNNIHRCNELCVCARDSNHQTTNAQRSAHQPKKWRVRGY